MLVNNGNINNKLFITTDCFTLCSWASKQMLEQACAYGQIVNKFAKSLITNYTVNEELTSISVYSENISNQLRSYTPRYIWAYFIGLKRQCFLNCAEKA